MSGDGGSAETKRGFRKWISSLRENNSFLIRKVIPNIMDRSAHKVLADAKRLAPVDTGALRASGRVEKKGRAERHIVFGGQGTGVDYAEYVEYGTLYMEAQPYLRPAMMKAQMTMKAEAFKQLNEAMLRTARRGGSR